MQFKNVGKFKVDGFFFRDLKPLDGVNLFRNMVVLDVEHSWNNDVRTYTAIHPDFDPIEPGDRVPEYVATFKDGEIAPTWMRSAEPRWTLA